MHAKISSVRFYKILYNYIGELTPIKGDCGKLCDRECCKVTDEITGMYLFPGENNIYKHMPKWGKIYDTDFKSKNGEYVDLFTCTGYCDRELRPLSCRIFPLVPYLKKGQKLKIIMDPRGKGMCPIASVMTINDIDKDFKKAVTKAMSLCMKNKRVREFLYALADSLDECGL